MKKLISVAAATAVVIPFLAAGAVFADSPGQLMGGNALYQVKNLTTSSAYASTISANACDEVEYSVELHNTEFGKLSNVTVKVNLPTSSTTSNVSTVDASATNSANTKVSVNGSVTVNLANAQSIAYETGSTQLFDGNGKLVKTLGEGIVSEGLNLGDLNGSTGEFVNFKAKVNCPQPPKQIQVCELATKKVITIKETDFNSTTQTKDLTKCATVTPPTVTPPTVLPNTGAGNVIGVVAGAIVAGTIAGRLFVSRKLARKA